MQPDEPQTSQPGRMNEASATGAREKSRLPRLGVIVRVLIYVPLLGFFGWQAVQRYQDGRRAADDGFRTSVEQWLKHPPRSVVMPNGDVMPVFELTEQEAVEMGLLPEPEPTPEPAPAP